MGTIFSNYAVIIIILCIKSVEGFMGILHHILSIPDAWNLNINVVLRDEMYFVIIILLLVIIAERLSARHVIAEYCVEIVCLY